MVGRITTVSGTTITFTHVKLYNVLHINHCKNLEAQAKSKAIPVTSPYGAFGGFTFVTGVLAANMLAERYVNAARHQQADSLFDQSFDLAERIRDMGEFVPVRLISKVEVPLPSVWRATIQKKINEEGGGSHAKKITATVIHNGDPYVVLRANGRELSVFWDKVESYAIEESRSA